MTLPQLSIKRPVFATVINLIIVLIGVICYTRLPVRQTPKIDTPVVNVATSYPGANAAVMESQITKPIEDALAGIEGVDFITSTSRAESSQVTIVFRVDRDPDDAASDVRDRVNQAREVLPDDAREPIVQKQEADAQPIIWLSFSSTRHSQLDIADFAQRLVKDRLQAIPGVAQARVFAADQVIARGSHAGAGGPQRRLRSRQMVLSRGRNARADRRDFVGPGHGPRCRTRGCL